MPKQFETEITRYDVFTVKSTHLDPKGNLIVESTHGVQHKIGVKRSQLFNLFHPGAEMKVGYAVFQGPTMRDPIEYIATAEQTGKHIVLQETPEPAQESVQSKSTPVKEEKGRLVKAVEKMGGVKVSDTKEEKMTKEDWSEKDKITRKSIERQKALELAVMFNKEPVDESAIIVTAQAFEHYLEYGD